MAHLLVPGNPPANAAAASAPPPALRDTSKPEPAKRNPSPAKPPVPFSEPWGKRARKRERMVHNMHTTSTDPNRESNMAAGSSCLYATAPSSRLPHPTRRPPPTRLQRRAGSPRRDATRRRWPVRANQSCRTIPSDEWAKANSAAPTAEGRSRVVGKKVLAFQVVVVPRAHVLRGAREHDESVGFRY